MTLHSYRVAALISVWSVDPSLHVDPKSSIVYRR